MTTGVRSQETGVRRRDLTKDFSRSEFACKCGCGFDAIDAGLVLSLQMLRTNIERPIVVLSGCRCRAHNAAVGGARDSMHLVGKAADIRVAGLTARQIYEQAWDMPRLNGMGVDDARNFLHVDVRETRARWCYAGGRQVEWHG